jgi:hypothetical protein
MVFLKNLCKFHPSDATKIYRYRLQDGVTQMQFNFFGFYVFYFKQQVFFQVKFFCRRRHNSYKLQSIVCWGPNLSIQRSLLFKISSCCRLIGTTPLSRLYLKNFGLEVSTFLGAETFFWRTLTLFLCQIFAVQFLSGANYYNLIYCLIIFCFAFPPLQPPNPLIYIRAFLSSPHIFIFMLN